MEVVAPSLWQCPYQRIYDQPCPLCHVTRDIAAISRGDIENVENVISIPLALSLLIQLCGRILLAISGRMKNSVIIVNEMALSSVSLLIYMCLQL